MSHRASTYTTPMWVEQRELAMARDKDMRRAAEARAELAEAELHTMAENHREELAKAWDAGFMRGATGNNVDNPWRK